jgi:hypothetical protein
MGKRVMGYTDDAGLTCRANSALGRITDVVESWHIPSSVRLVMIAEIMAGEPILTDESSAAYGARANRKKFKSPITSIQSSQEKAQWPKPGEATVHAIVKEYRITNMGESNTSITCWLTLAQADLIRETARLLADAVEEDWAPGLVITEEK